jgi:hypothetical protein
MNCTRSYNLRYEVRDNVTLSVTLSKSWAGACAIKSLGTRFVVVMRSELLAAWWKHEW